MYNHYSPWVLSAFLFSHDPRLIEGFVQASHITIYLDQYLEPLII